MDPESVRTVDVYNGAVMGYNQTINLLLQLEEAIQQHKIAN